LTHNVEGKLVRRVAFVVAVGSVVGLALIAKPGHASLYSADTQFAIPFDQGKPAQLTFDEFRRRRAVLTNALIEPKTGEESNPDRAAFLKRIDEQIPKGTQAEKEKALRKIPASVFAAMATDVFRTGQVDRALNLLVARRGGGYFVSSALAHVHAARGEWDEALRYHIEGRFDTQMPEEVKGLSKEQRDWWERLDAGYVTHYYRVHAQDAAARAKLTPAERDKHDEREETFPLFPLPEEGKPHAPVRFVNDAGQYEPGVLAAAEKAKLPPDAVAVVQQLILWFPTDVRLYWLLAELYTAEGDLDSAIVIFDECTWSLRYGNRQTLMDHRNAVRAAIDARPKPPGPPISMRTILLYFAGVGVVAVFALGRVLYKRARAPRGPVTP
jgi:hypothetical protein